MNSKNYFKLVFISCLLGSSFIVSGCATAPLKNMSLEDQHIKDPYKNINKPIYAFNNKLDKAIVKPVAEFFNDTVPSPVKTGLNNFLNNLSEPKNVVNNLLQLKIDDSLTSLSRFAFNTTLGLGGLIDIMELGGTDEKREDLGQTLAYFGVKPGAYVMLPFFGPSNVRDALGRVGDTLMYSPSRDIDEDVNFLSYAVLNAIDTRTQLLALDSVLEQQSDPYSFIRSAYEQSRINAVYDGKPPEMKEDF